MSCCGEHGIRVKFSRSPVPLNRRLTIAPVSRDMSGYAGFYSSKRKVGYEMVLTAEYRRWLREQVKILALTKAQAHLKTISKPCVCLVIWSRPADKRKHDIDGVLKAPFDALTEAQIVKDDSLISASMIVTMPPKHKGEMELLLMPLAHDTPAEQSQVLMFLLEQVLKERANA